MEACHLLPILFSFISFSGDLLLAFSRHQMMYNLSYVVLCVEVTHKWYFVIQ